MKKTEILQYIVLLGLVIVGFSNIMHSVHMLDSAMPAEHCPYSQSTEVACLQNTSSSAAVSFLGYLTKSPVYYMGVLSLLFLAILLSKKEVVSHRLRRRKIIFDAQTLLFFKGILNPKVF